MAEQPPVRPVTEADARKELRTQLNAQCGKQDTDAREGIGIDFATAQTQQELADFIEKKARDNRLGALDTLMGGLQPGSTAPVWEVAGSTVMDVLTAVMMEVPGWRLVELAVDPHMYKTGCWVFSAIPAGAEGASASNAVTVEGLFSLRVYSLGTPKARPKVSIKFLKGPVGQRSPPMSLARLMVGPAVRWKTIKEEGAGAASVHLRTSLMPQQLAGLDAAHICHNSRCVRPLHIRLLERGVNRGSERVEGTQKRKRSQAAAAAVA
jgi:hypothetical protein